MMLKKKKKRKRKRKRKRKTLFGYVLYYTTI
jgi:hypothetical protein